LLVAVASADPPAVFEPLVSVSFTAIWDVAVDTTCFACSADVPVAPEPQPTKGNVSATAIVSKVAAGWNDQGAQSDTVARYGGSPG
jgi:hypothetical protein